MDRLSEFKPLEQVTLPDIGDLRCAGLTLIVGPNSSGKSQLLQDLYLRLCGGPRTLVVASNIRISKPPEYNPFIRSLEREGYLRSFVDGTGTAQLRPLTTYVGSGQPVGTVQSRDAENWYNSYDPTRPSESQQSQFLNHFGRLLVTALFLDRRLTSLNQVAVIDFLSQPPQQDLHALYLDDKARDDLSKELIESFGKAVWLDTSQGTTLCIRVSDKPVLPPADERLSPKKMALYRTMETEGDGLKSYVATCISLLLGRRPVCLIDEPEMCLHPPQAYSLGQFIGQYGSSTDTATFVATHSSQILRGVIQTRRNVQIVRLTRREGEFSAHLVPTDVLTTAVAKPTVRAESVLDGIFAQSVIVVEADGDRLVYQTVWESLAAELPLDAHFAAVGGTGGIADVCRLYRTLNIPVAVVADLDLISDPNQLSRVLEAIATAEAARSISFEARFVLEEIRKLPPTVSSEEVHRFLVSLSKQSLEWNNKDDIIVRRELTQMAEKLSRMRKLKHVDIPLPETIATALTRLVSNLEALGIFLVPVGELEEWLAGEGISESKTNKWAWANAAAMVIQAKGTTQGDIWDFVRRIGACLSRADAVSLLPRSSATDRAKVPSAR